MAALVYIIIKGEGEYSNRSEEPVKASLDRAWAESTMAQLEAIEKKYHSLLRQVYEDLEPLDYNNKDTIRQQEMNYKAAIGKLLADSRYEYEAMGFDANMENDWKLCTAELN